MSTWTVGGHVQRCLPYEYMDSLSRFDEIQLPPKAAFFSNLKKEDITYEDYVRAQHMWYNHDCFTLGDYHDLYLLADVFQSYRNIAHL